MGNCFGKVSAPSEQVFPQEEVESRFEGPRWDKVHEFTKHVSALGKVWTTNSEANELFGNFFRLDFVEKRGIQRKGANAHSFDITAMRVEYLSLLWKKVLNKQDILAKMETKDAAARTFWGNGKALQVLVNEITAYTNK